MHQTVTTHEEGLPDLLTVKEIAATLRVDPETIRAWVRAGRLPALRLSPIDLRIRREALEAFIEAAAKAPRARRRPVGAKTA